MAECCIVGCSNKAGKRGGLRFYTLPTSKSFRPNKVKRRRLWLEAIEKANGTTAGLKEDAQICSAHFISGQMSLDDSNQDFVPSVFPKRPDKTRRDTLRPRSAVSAEAVKVPPQTKAERKQTRTSVLPEINYCEPLEDEDFMEEGEEKEVVEDTSQVSTNLIPTTQSTIHAASELPQLCTNEKAIETTDAYCTQVTTAPPIEVPKPAIEVLPEYPPLKKPKLELKSVVARLGLFQCEVCNGKFSSGTMLVKHKRLHEQEWSDDESWPSVTGKVSEDSDITYTSAPVEELQFKCNMCDRSFPTTHSLKRHKLLHVRDARKCKQCGTMFCKRHNHVVALPQISTETNFERSTTGNAMNVPAENMLLGNNSCTSDNNNESLESQRLDAIAAAQDQSLDGTDQKPVPNITNSSHRPGLLTAFKSFLTKHKVANIKTEQVEPSICITSTSSTTQNVESVRVATDTIVKQPVIIRTTTAVTAHSATSSATSTTPLDTTATKPVPVLSTIGVPVRTSTSILAPKPVLLITNSSNLQKGQPSQQSTLCLSFSNSLSSTVVKEVMSLINTHNSSKPRLVTLSSKPVAVAPKQDTPANQIPSLIKLEPSVEPIKVPQLQNKPTAHSEEDKTTFIVTRRAAPHPEVLPSPVKAVPPINSPEKSKSIAKKTKQAKPSPLQQVPLKKYIHGCRPPIPEPIIAKIQNGPWNSPFPNHPKDFIQPHLPQMPELPPSLQMFSPQFLTSAFLDVKRNYDYILSK